ASNPSTAGVSSNPSPFIGTPPHSPGVTPVSPPKPSAAAPSNVSSHPDVPPETSVLLGIYLYLLVPTGRYAVPTGRVIATVSIKVPTGMYIVPAGYI
ncbi:hypothetical protein Tco_0563088, partial [Tanacetum coccineum]